MSKIQYLFQMLNLFKRLDMKKNSIKIIQHLCFLIVLTIFLFKKFLWEIVFF